MNTTCRICHQLTLEQRADVEARVLRSEPYAGIERDYPGITRYVVYKHMKHAGNPKNEADVQAIRLTKEITAEKLRNFDYQHFIVELRDRLACVALHSQDLLETWMQDVEDEVKSPEELNQIVTAQQKIFANLDTVSGIKKLINIDAAMSLIMAEGYKISIEDEK